MTHPAPRALVALLTLAAATLCSAAAFAIDRPAGPIWNNSDAKAKCPQVCGQGEEWNGQWRTVRRGKQSVCGCVPIAVQAPPTVVVQPVAVVVTGPQRYWPLPPMAYPPATYWGPGAAPVQVQVQVPVAVPAPMPVGHDGCQQPGQPCVCGNTQWRGQCGEGPHKQGLYCRCD